MTFSRKELYDVWVEQSAKNKDSAVRQYVSDQSVIKGINDEREKELLINSVKMFLTKLREKWVVFFRIFFGS